MISTIELVFFSSSNNSIHDYSDYTIKNTDPIATQKK